MKSYHKGSEHLAIPEPSSVPFTHFIIFFCFVLDGASVVGLDLEWKPTMVVGNGDLSLLQLATHERVYLIDVLALCHVQHLWKTFAKLVLHNNNIIKLGNAYLLYPHPTQVKIYWVFDDVQKINI